MKRTIVLAVIVMLALTASSFAATATGALTVSATITPSLQFVFQSDASGVALSAGSGTSAATLAFPAVSAFGTAPTGVTLVNTPASSQFSISTNVGFLVNEANVAQVTSNNYTLKAALQTADSTNHWTVGSSATLTTTAATVTATGVYGTTATPFAVQIVIPYSNTSATISNTINFTVTTN